ncbi:MAG: putative hydrolase of the superfamily [Acidimicrobiaceae bacterium]|jgi:putative hydrolase of the HAD superfamily
MTLEAVVFDWGGTLTAGSTIVNLELEDVWRASARRLDPAREEELTAALFKAERHFWERTTTTLESGTLADLLAAASLEVGLDVTDALLEEAASHHLDAWTPHIEHDADAIAVLTELRTRGLRTALLSNTHWPRAFHEHFLERDGLASLLDARLYSSELQYMKPHPSVFIAALNAIGVSDPANAVFVGDRPYDDISGAKAVGMHTVLRANPYVPPYDVEPDAVIDGLFDLLAAIDLL